MASRSTRSVGSFQGVTIHVMKDPDHGDWGYRVGHESRKTYGFSTKAEAVRAAKHFIELRHERRRAQREISRSRARENPSTGAWLAIGLGVTALGVGAYFLAKSMSAKSSSSPQLPPAPAGDKYVTITIPGQAGQGVVLLSQACAAARALAANGNAADAAVWAQVCRDNGGSV